MDPGAAPRSDAPAGKGLNDGGLGEALIRDAPERLDEMVRWGLQGVAEKGQLYVLGPPPVWGREIVRCLLERAAAVGVRFRSGLTAARICLADGAADVLCFSPRSGEWVRFSARALVLATGGAGALYLRHDNPQHMLGEGYALALEAGAALRDMEFFQFLPISTAEPGRPQFAIPSTIAGRGRLVNGRGEEILDKYAIRERPADVHARDRLSQALMTEIRNGETLFLDLRGVTEREWAEDALGTARILREKFRAKSRSRARHADCPFLHGWRLRRCRGSHLCPGALCRGRGDRGAPRGEPARGQRPHRGPGLRCPGRCGGCPLGGFACPGKSAARCG